MLTKAWKTVAFSSVFVCTTEPPWSTRARNYSVSIMRCNLTEAVAMCLSISSSPESQSSLTGNSWALTWTIYECCGSQTDQRIGHSVAQIYNSSGLSVSDSPVSASIRVGQIILCTTLVAAWYIIISAGVATSNDSFRKPRTTIKFILRAQVRLPKVHLKFVA